MNTLLKYVLGGVLLKGIYNYFSKEEGNEEQTKRKRIFISHSWKISSEDYESLKNKFKENDIQIYDHSIPEHKAFEENDRTELEKIFRKQMIYCSKIFVLAHKDLKMTSFVMIEIKIAKELKKEIIAIKPHGQKTIPRFIEKNATKIISNNINSIEEVFKDNY